MKKTSQPSTDADQSARFIEAARAAECSEDEAVFDANMRKIAKVRPARTERYEPGAAVKCDKQQ